VIALRLLWWFISSLLYNVVLWLPLWLLGFLVFPVQWALRRSVTSPIYIKIILQGPRWCWIWNNDEDGLYPPPGHRFLLEQQAKKRPKWWTAFWWTTMRNSVDNLKYVPLINPPQPLPGRLCEWNSGRPILLLFWWKGYSCLYFTAFGVPFRIGYRLTGPGFTAERL